MTIPILQFGAFDVLFFFFVRNIKMTEYIKNSRHHGTVYSPLLTDLLSTSATKKATTTTTKQQNLLLVETKQKTVQIFLFGCM